MDVQDRNEAAAYLAGHLAAFDAEQRQHHQKLLNDETASIGLDMANGQAHRFYEQWMLARRPVLIALGHVPSESGAPTLVEARAIVEALPHGLCVID